MQTFLFTDIESSTQLWEKHPREMTSALARHDEIISAAIEASGGKVLKTTGDGFIAVFDDASHALTTSIESQKGLDSEDWGETGPLRVRMGIHAGDTEEREGDFFGPVMNRTARIMAAGHGGQILVSAAVVGLLLDQPNDPANLVDLGSHRLKDLTSPEHIYQVLVEGMPNDFPDLNSLDARANNLPLQTTEFLGRQADLAAVQLMLDSPGTRLLTIAGPGGAGKTRLSLQVAAEQVDRYRDGVFFVDLASEQDADAAFEATLRALHITASGSGDSLETLKTRLRDRQMLVVLDNFEQVMTAATGVAELLQQASDLKIIVTSRETLRVRPEQVYPVPPLVLPRTTDTPEEIGESDAVQLFVVRAQSARPDFVLDASNATAIAEICLRLDGLPLAIELAAARLNLFTTDDLLARLQDRLDVLSAGGRDRPDRQRTLWGAIGWSYELLSEEECRLFQLMSVFSSTHLGALESVAEESGLDSHAVLDTLASLVDKSLITTEAGSSGQRFSMLLMIKEYAVEQLAASAEFDHAVRMAHARYFSDFALQLQGRLRGPEHDRVLEELGDEIGNLRTAWRFWVEQGQLEELFKLLDGLWALHEAKGWYHAAIELATDTLGVLASAEPSAELASEELAIRTSLARALLAVRGYVKEVEEAFTKVLQLSQSTGVEADQVPIQRALASYYMQTGAMHSALDVGRKLLAAGQAADDDAITLEGHYVMGTAISFGDVEASAAHLEKAISMFDPKRHGGSRFRLGPNTGVVARVSLGMVLWQGGSLDTAVASLRDALDLAREIEHPYSIAFALHHNGFISLNRRRFDDALAYSRELAEIADENDYELWGTLAAAFEGVAVAATSDPGGGLAKTEEAIVRYQLL